MKPVELRLAAAAVSLVLAAGLIVGPDAEAQRKKGAAIGAGLGALLGQGIGKDTESTLIGAGVGAGVGYIIGNERDRKKAESISQPKAEPAPQAQAAAPAAESTPAAADPAKQPDAFDDDLLLAREDVGILAGTIWKLTSMNPAPEAGSYLAKVIEFRPNGTLWTITTLSDGDVMVTEETYRVVDDVLIINKPGYLINARFLMEEEQLIMNAQDFSAVFARLTPE